MCMFPQSTSLIILCFLLLQCKHRDESTSDGDPCLPSPLIPWKWRTAQTTVMSNKQILNTYIILQNMLQIVQSSDLWGLKVSLSKRILLDILEQPWFGGSFGIWKRYFTVLTSLGSVPQNYSSALSSSHGNIFPHTVPQNHKAFSSPPQWGRALWRQAWHI